jgi:hypothetical protein
MSISTTQPVYYDYTQEFVDIKNSIDALTTAVLAVKTSIDTNSVIINTTLDNKLTQEIIALQSSASSIANILNRVSNSTLGLYTNAVDVPFQGVNQRALTRMALKDGGVVSSDIKRAVEEEKIDPLFPV